MASVDSIYICPAEGQSMQPVRMVRAIPDLGLEGDRYALGTGHYSKILPAKVRDVSLIARHGISAANRDLKVRFTPAEARRNLVLDYISSQELEELMGREFWVGEVRMFGSGLCTPCDRPSTLCNKPEFARAFQHRGGLRAQILTPGYIWVGDVLRKA